MKDNGKDDDDVDGDYWEDERQNGHYENKTGVETREKM